MAAFEPLAARPVQANPLREEIRKLPTGVGFQGVRSVFVQLSIMASKCDVLVWGCACFTLGFAVPHDQAHGLFKSGF
jgi:hypothetical protein